MMAGKVLSAFVDSMRMKGKWEVSGMRSSKKERGLGEWTMRREEVDFCLPRATRSFEMLLSAD